MSNHFAETVFSCDNKFV